MKKLLIILIGVLFLSSISCDNPSNSVPDVQTPVNLKLKFVGTWTNKYIDYPTLSTDIDQYQLIITENTIKLKLRRDDGTYGGSRFTFDSCDESKIYFYPDPLYYGYDSGYRYWQEYEFTSDDEIEWGNTNLGHWWGPWIRVK
jgi:hypothetical protein